MIGSNGSRWLRVSAIVAVVFGLLTMKSGGSVLFIDGEARRAAGHYVDFVVWFNFVAGFLYGVTGIWLEKRWAATAAAAGDGLFDAPALIMFWYLGLTGLWVMLVTASVAGIAMFLNRASQWLKRPSDHSKGQRQHFPHAAA